MDIEDRLDNLSMTLRMVDRPGNQLILNPQPSNYYSELVAEAVRVIENLRTTVDVDQYYLDQQRQEIERLKGEIERYQERIRHVIRAATGVYQRGGEPQ